MNYNADSTCFESMVSFWDETVDIYNLDGTEIYFAVFPEDISNLYPDLIGSYEWVTGKLYRMGFRW